MPNFTVVALKMWAYTGVKIAKIANFWYNFAKKGYTPLTNFSPKGYIPLSHFYKIFPRGGSPMPNFTIVALKMWPYGSRNRQKW